MRVSSPVGELPFQAESMRLKRGQLRVDGSMGAWPAKVEIELGDVAKIGRLVVRDLGRPLALAVVVTGVTAIALRSRRDR